MTDNRSGDTIEYEHDEYHSALEMDDSSGWRVFIVPGLMLLILIGAILMIVFYQGEGGDPDPRIADRLKRPEQATVQAPPQGASVTVGEAQPSTQAAAEPQPQ
jgi:hypothetical protein